MPSALFFKYTNEYIPPEGYIPEDRTSIKEQGNLELNELADEWQLLDQAGTEVFPILEGFYGNIIAAVDTGTQIWDIEWADFEETSMGYLIWYDKVSGEQIKDIQINYLPGILKYAGQSLWIGYGENTRKTIYRYDLTNEVLEEFTLDDVYNQLSIYDGRVWISSQTENQEVCDRFLFFFR